MKPRKRRRMLSEEAKMEASGEGNAVNKKQREQNADTQ